MSQIVFCIFTFLSLITSYPSLKECDIDIKIFKPKSDTKKQLSLGKHFRTNSNSNSTGSRKLDLLNILSDIRSINSFFEHLLKEYSVENLIAFIEMLQFRQFYQTKFVQIMKILVSF